jgi:hypothetical protein
MNAWTPQGAPILTYARPRFAGYAHYERTGFWGSQKHLRVYPSGLLYQTFDEMKVENRGPVISVNEKALFFPVRPDQIEALSFVLVEFSGQF